MRKKFLIFIILLTSLFCHGAKDSKNLIREIDEEVRKIDYEYKLEKKHERIGDKDHYMEPIIFYHDKKGNVRKITQTPFVMDAIKKEKFYIKDGKIICVIHSSSAMWNLNEETQQTVYYLNPSGKVVMYIKKTIKKYQNGNDLNSPEEIIDVENLSKEEQKKINDRITKPVKFIKKI